MALHWCQVNSQCAVMDAVFICIGERLRNHKEFKRLRLCNSKEITPAHQSQPSMLCCLLHGLPNQQATRKLFWHTIHTHFYSLAQLRL